jgi:glycerol-3-phosphate dehydrogenase (NAD(P)+)
VASLVAANPPTVLWARHLEVVREINERHTNHVYLPDLSLHDGIVATDSLEAAPCARPSAAWAACLRPPRFKGVA